MTLPGPVAIGGVGGSGTRVVAQMFIDLGYYMGRDLNRPKDNLLFTLLFKRPHWYRHVAQQHPAAVRTGLRVFEAAMTGTFAWTPRTVAFIGRAWLELQFGRHTMLPRWRWGMERLRALARVNTAVDYAAYHGWGWKEPNTHLYLEHLAAHFPDLRYIHVLRHGLDMAYSQNQQQLENWGWLYDVALPDDPADVPQASLTYWIRSNQTAVETGQQLLGERFMTLNFEQLCTSPASEVDKLLHFLGHADLDAAQRKQLIALPQLPPSAGRYKQAGLEIFPSEDIAAVRALGFAVD